MASCLSTVIQNRVNPPLAISWGTNSAAQTALQPAIPTARVPPEPVAIGSVLMKPAGTGGESVDGWYGGPQFSARSGAIPEWQPLPVRLGSAMFLSFRKSLGSGVKRRDR